MSELGQWLFNKERLAIEGALAKRLPRTGTVLTVSSPLVTVNDPLVQDSRDEPISVLGQMPIVGERVLITILADGERVAQRIGLNSASSLTYGGSGGDWGTATAVARADHIHDARYYRNDQVDTLLSYKASSTHDHDDRYYTEAEIIAALAGKSNTGHTHDDRYLRSVGVSSGRVLTLRAMGYSVGTLTGVALTANRCYYLPIFVPVALSLASLTYWITTYVAGQVQLGLYDVGSTLLPTNLLVSGTKNTPGSTGVKTQAISYNVSPGWYAIALASTSAMSLQGSVTAANLPSMRGGEDANLSTVYMMASETLTSGWTSLPASASPGSLSNTYLHMGAVVS